MHETHISPRFQLYMGTTWGLHGLEIWVVSGIVRGFNIGPMSITYIGYMEDFTCKVGPKYTTNSNPIHLQDLCGCYTATTWSNIWVAQGIVYALNILPLQIANLDFYRFNRVLKWAWPDNKHNTHMGPVFIQYTNATYVWVTHDLVFYTMNITHTCALH